MSIRFISLIIFILLAGTAFLFSGCAEEAVDAELLISNEEFSITQTGVQGYEVYARGTVRNVGDVDVRDLTMVGDCPSCNAAFRQANWYKIEVEKTDDQKAVIRYLGKGERANFEVKGLAFFSTAGGAAPTELPTELKTEIISYTVVK